MSAVGQKRTWGSVVLTSALRQLRTRLTPLMIGNYPHLPPASEALLETDGKRLADCWNVQERADIRTPIAWPLSPSSFPACEQRQRRFPP